MGHKTEYSDDCGNKKGKKMVGKIKYGGGTLLRGKMM